MGIVRETEITAVFVVHRGQLVSSSCNGARPIRIVVAKAYPELARLVHPLRRNVLNGITLTVRWHEMPNDPSIDPYGRVPAPDPSARIVTHISAVEAGPTTVRSLGRRGTSSSMVKCAFLTGLSRCKFLDSAQLMGATEVMALISSKATK